MNIYDVSWVMNYATHCTDVPDEDDISYSELMAMVNACREAQQSGGEGHIYFEKWNFHLYVRYQHNIVQNANEFVLEGHVDDEVMPEYTFIPKLDG